MNTKLIATALAVALLATAAHAQTASNLNLKLPPGSVPASASTAAAPARPGDAPPAMDAVNARPAGSAASTRAAPGVYYGDTSGRTAAQDEAEAEAARPHCDDATYNQPQVHGSVGMGVVTGNHWGSGTYNSGAVNVTQRLGDCSHPTGSIGLSIGVSRFNGR
ncbi:hypothetical protein [Dyella sp. 2RAB6]|uniref:hypothetical protein n=1 Tax=Dyella sp. 2RAB6 TaxID=3232992 RepID=UPI003F9350BA